MGRLSRETSVVNFRHHRNVVVSASGRVCRNSTDVGTAFSSNVLRSRVSETANSIAASGMLRFIQSSSGESCGYRSAIPEMCKIVYECIHD